MKEGVTNRRVALPVAGGEPSHSICRVCKGSDCGGMSSGLKEPDNKSPAGATAALRDGMRERRRCEWCERAGREQCLPQEDAAPVAGWGRPNSTWCSSEAPLLPDLNLDVKRLLVLV